MTLCRTTQWGKPCIDERYAEEWRGNFGLEHGEPGGQALDQTGGVPAGTSTWLSCACRLTGPLSFVGRFRARQATTLCGASLFSYLTWRIS